MVGFQCLLDAAPVVHHREGSNADICESIAGDVGAYAACQIQRGRGAGRWGTWGSHTSPAVSETRPQTSCSARLLASRCATAAAAAAAPGTSSTLSSNAQPSTSRVHRALSHCRHHRGPPPIPPPTPTPGFFLPTKHPPFSPTTPSPR